MKRKIYTKLVLEELSAVDRPAQPGALVAVIKRHEGFDDKVSAIQKRDGCSICTAMSRARIEHPDLFAAMRAAPIGEPFEKRGPDEVQLAVAKARGEFMDRAHAIAKRDKVRLDVAMGRARREAPELFAAWA